jgi:sugar phosphate isomerase/epimerase
VIQNLDSLAVCSWSLEPTSCDDLIAKVRQCGLTAVQLHLDPLSDAGWEQTPQRLRDAGIEVISGMVNCVGEDYASIAAITRTGGVVPDETWPNTRDAMQQAATFAKAMNLSLVTFHPGFIPHDAADPSQAKILDRLRESASIFADVGSAIALETGQEPAEALQAVLEALDREKVGVNFDPANMILYGSGDPISALKTLLPRVRQVHLKDAVASNASGSEWGSEVPVGEGSVDWPGFFATIDTANVNAAIEREAGEARVDDVRTAVRFVDQLAA